MGKCKDCGQEMTEAKTCSLRVLEKDGKIYERDIAYYDVNKRCHDCGIENKKGNIHHLSCDIERCPICKGQLLSCGCFNY